MRVHRVHSARHGDGRPTFGVATVLLAQTAFLCLAPLLHPPQDRGPRGPPDRAGGRAGQMAVPAHGLRPLEVPTGAARRGSRPAPGSPTASTDPYGIQADHGLLAHHLGVFDRSSITERAGGRVLVVDAARRVRCRRGRVAIQLRPPANKTRALAVS